MTKSLTGFIFLNITPNELILFPTSLKYFLVYFKIYLKKNLKQLLVLFVFCVLILYIAKIGFLKRGETFKSFEVHPDLPHIEGKHSESRHNILV